LIKPIFNNIESLYREATNSEVQEFLNNDFISLSEGYSPEFVGTMNRKRIASALKTYNNFSLRFSSDSITNLLSVKNSSE
jgi:hypothetical protein